MAERPTDSADFRIRAHGPSGLSWIVLPNAMPLWPDKVQAAMDLRSLAEKLWAAADWVEDDS